MLDVPTFYSLFSGYSLISLIRFLGIVYSCVRVKEKLNRRTEQIFVTLTPVSCIREVCTSNLGPVTSYPNWGCPYSSSVSCYNDGILPWNKPDHLFQHSLLHKLMNWPDVTCNLTETVLNPLNPELNPICYLLALLAHHFLHVSRIMVKSLPLRL